MSAGKSNISKKAKEKFSANPLIKLWDDKKRIVKAIKEGGDLSKLKGTKIGSPL